MKPEPSSHSKSLPSSPPSLSCCLLHTGTLWNIRPSSNRWGNLRVPPAAAPSSQGQHPQEQSTGWIQGIQPGWERGNRRVRLCPAPAEKFPAQSYHNPGSGQPQPQSSQESSHHPQGMPGGPWAQIKPSPGSWRGVAGGEGGPKMGDSPTWVTGMSPPLVAVAESCQAPAPFLPPGRNAARARAKSLPRQLPTGTQSLGEVRGRGAGGDTSSSFRVATGQCPPCGNVHVLMLRGTLQYPQYTLSRGAGVPQCAPFPAWHHPELTAQGVGAALAPSAQPGWSQEAPDPWWGCPGEQLGTSGGSLGNSLGMLQGSQASVPPGDVPVCHHGQEQGDTQMCQTLSGMPQPSDRVMDRVSTVPDLSTHPRD